MINETQLTVQTVIEKKILSLSYDTSYGGAGSLRILVPYYSGLSSLTTITLVNSLNETQTITVTSVDAYPLGQPEAVINFNTILFHDFTQGFGGYYLDNVIESIPLDLYKNESISQTWTFTDLGSLETRSPFTRQFRIPNTLNNQKIFEGLLDVNYSKLDNFFLYRLPAQIAIDGVPIIEGYLKLNKVIRQRDLLTDFDVTFFGKTSDLGRDIGSKKLSDLDIQLNATVDYNTIDLAKNGALDFLFAMCDRGQRWNMSGGRSFNSPIYAGDYTPALKWSYLFHEIVTQAGWTYEADDLINTLAAIWMPWLNSIDIKVTTNPTVNRTFRARLATDQLIGPSPTPGGLFVGNAFLAPTINISNPGGWWLNSTSEYLVSLSGLYSFQIQLVIEVIGTGIPMTDEEDTFVQIYLDNTVTGVSTYINQVSINASQTTYNNYFFKILKILFNKAN